MIRRSVAARKARAKPYARYFGGGAGVVDGVCGGVVGAGHDHPGRFGSGFA